MVEKRERGRRRVFPRQRALIPLDVSQRVANIDLRGTSTLFNPRRRCFICLLVALSSAFLHHPQRHTLAEFLSVSRLSSPCHFPPFLAFTLSLSLWYISSFVCERLPQTNWIRRGSQSYRITLTAEKCRSRWRILAEPSRSHALGTIREWKHSVARGKDSRIRSKFDPRDNFDGGRIFESIRRPSLKSKIDITFATPRDPKDFTIGMIPGETSGFWNRIEGVILFRGEKSRETGRNFAASFAAGRDPRADAETPPVL